MVRPGEALADAVLHQAGQRGQDVDGGIDTGLVHIPVQHNLSLGDVAGQVGDGVSDVVVGHSEDGHLGHGPGLALDHARPLVQGG